LAKIFGLGHETLSQCLRAALDPSPSIMMADLTGLECTKLNSQRMDAKNVYSILFNGEFQLRLVAFAP
jgi:hypothetical protein